MGLEIQVGTCILGAYWKTAAGRDAFSDNELPEDQKWFLKRKKLHMKEKNSSVYYADGEGSGYLSNLRTLNDASPVSTPLLYCSIALEMTFNVGFWLEP